MKGTSDERMDQARAFFSARAVTEQDPQMRETFAHLEDMAESVQEVVRSLDYIKLQLQEIRHTLSVR